MLFAVLIGLAACSSGSDQSKKTTGDASEANVPTVIKSARQACNHLRKPARDHEEVDVGISEYEACLGKQANLSLPANPRLCDLAKGTMSASGMCVLGE